MIFKFKTKSPDLEKNLNLNYFNENYFELTMTGGILKLMNE